MPVNIFQRFQAPCFRADLLILICFRCGLLFGFFLILTRAMRMADRGGTATFLVPILRRTTRPNWSGFMQYVSIGNHPPKSRIQMLPIIDLNPADETCIYSTFLYVQSQADKLNIPTPCITFDQPLWKEAVEIIDAKSLNIVCRLGGFHITMSFLGNIGFLMEGSGLSYDVWEGCFKSYKRILFSGISAHDQTHGSGASEEIGSGRRW